MQRHSVPYRSDRLSQGGIALVVVLITLALLVMTVVAFLSSMEADRSTASAYSAAGSTRHLARMTLELVQAQIRDATLEGIDEDGVAHTTWASQPGMIRTFSDAPNGPMATAYKLYSAMPLRVEGGGIVDTSADLPADWESQPDLYVDLNAPVRRSAHLDKRDYPILNPEMTATPSGFRAASPPGGGANPAPMPVRWLYVFKDGTLGERSNASASNPVIGRVAFWTDDESTKINLNTASASTNTSHWDLPTTGDEASFYRYAWRQPGQHEYQRFPGHPAMVNLGAAFPAFSQDASGLQQLLSITPRYQWGGSEDARLRVKHDTRTPLSEDKGDRLYASVDELLFAIDRRQQPLLNPTLVEQSRFFITATSRSPDLNLFGQPRISLWPLHADRTKRTPIDQLTALCATAGPLSYSFERENPRSQTVDSTLGRNPAILDYLGTLMDRPLPGYGESLVSRYGTANAAQLRTMMFDYLRSGVNLLEAYTHSGTVNPQTFSYTPFPTLAPTNSENTSNAGMGMVAPIRIGTTRGMGRLPVISEAGIWIIRTALDATDSNRFEAALIFETFTPMQGYSPFHPDYEIEVRSGATPLRVGGIELLSTPMTRRVTHSSLKSGGDFIGGVEGISAIAVPINGYYGRLHTQPDRYPIVGAPFSTADPAISIGGDIEVEIRIDSQVIQTYTLSFPAADLPRPSLGSPGANDNRINHWKARDVALPIDTGLSGSGRASLIRAGRGTTVTFAPEDVVHSIQLSHGDYRLIALMESVPSSLYVRHPDYGTARSFAHSFRFGYGLYHPGATFGQYTNAPYYERPSTRLSHRQKISPAITSLRPTWSGDYDNGLGVSLDGPYFNKPDEGNVPRDSQPYYDPRWDESAGLYSPIRQIPSAAMFGSLPSNPSTPWQTLLFCPYPLMGPGHPGTQSPPDRVLLDFFHHPVVVPYAISEPFSTAGRVNLNYGIEPFRHLRRATGMHGVLTPVRLMTLNDSDAQGYKVLYNVESAAGGTRLSSAHQPIDVDETLKQFDHRFQRGDVFRTAADLASVHLIPAGVTLPQPGDAAFETNLDIEMDTFWQNRQIIGDNKRERPYAILYPQVTVRSNTYTVHFRVQALKPGRTQDHIVGEYRGSWLFERLIDPNDPRLTDGSTNPDTQSLEPLYRYRLLQAREFMP